jgi:hypothetical protein
VEDEPEDYHIIGLTCASSLQLALGRNGVSQAKMREVNSGLIIASFPGFSFHISEGYETASTVHSGDSTCLYVEEA